MNSSKENKPLYVKLKEYMGRSGTSNKDIAKILDWSPSGMSEYLNGKAMKDSKLDTIASLFLRVKDLEETVLSSQEIEDLKASNEILRMKVARYEGEISALKTALQMFKDIQNMNSAELTTTIETIVKQALDKHGVNSSSKQ